MKNIIITGASNGIGKAIAKSLRKKYNIINIDKEEIDFKDVDFYKCDLSSKKQLKKTIKKIKTKYDTIHALINNAGYGIFKPIEEQSIDEWDSVINTNLRAPYILSKEFSIYLKQSQGHIINISSIRAIMSESGTESYSASKGGIVSLTHALAVSLSPEVNVNCISPGWINTHEGFLPTKNDHKQHLSARVGETSDIVDTVRFLLKNKGFITGTNIVVDGGMTRKMIYV